MRTAILLIFAVFSATTSARAEQPDIVIADFEGETYGDWVVTGEGCFDKQSLRGKVLSGITKRAQKYGVNVAVIAGNVRVSESAWRREGIEVALSAMDPGVELHEAMASAERLLALTARQLVARILI